MNRKKNTSLILICICTLVLYAAPNLVDAQAAAATLGIFDDHRDVGTVLHPGSAEYDPSTASYTISGSGENMWFGKDAYHFVGKKVSGDISLTADADFITKTGNPHKKAVLMFRQSLDTVLAPEIACKLLPARSESDLSKLEMLLQTFLRHFREKARNP